MTIISVFDKIPPVLTLCMVPCRLFLLLNCVVFYFSSVLREILTSLEVIKQNQQLILLQLQRSQQPVEVPEVSGIPLASQEDLRRLEERISANAEYKQNLVGIFQ